MNPLPESRLRSALLARSLNELYTPRTPPVVFSRGLKANLYDLAARTVGAQPITYLEFGVHKGKSITAIAKRFTHPDAKFIGFDSFEGLPESWGGMRVGHFSRSGQPPLCDDQRVRFIKGWFQNTVPRFFASSAVNTPVMVHFDADLYSSTLFLLTTLWHKIYEYHFIFDDFMPDEVVALYDFTRAYPVEFEFFGSTLNEKERPLQVFGHMKRVALEL